MAPMTSLTLHVLLLSLTAASCLNYAAAASAPDDNKGSTPAAVGHDKPDAEMASSSEHHKTPPGAGDEIDSDVIDDLSSETTNDDKRAMGMLRLGRSRQSDQRRGMSALRLGRRGGNSGSSWSSSSDNNDDRDKRKSMSMLRLGRGHEEEEQQQEDQQINDSDDDEQQRQKKRAMSALRLGRKRGSDVGSSQPEMTSSENDGNASSAAAIEKRRAMAMLRLGRKVDGKDDGQQGIDEEGEMMREEMMGEDAGVGGDEEKRAMSALRLGRRGQNFNAGAPPRVERRKSMSMLRLG